MPIVIGGDDGPCFLKILERLRQDAGHQKPLLPIHRPGIASDTECRAKSFFRLRKCHPRVLNMSHTAQGPGKYDSEDCEKQEVKPHEQYAGYDLLA